MDPVAGFVLRKGERRWKMRRIVMVVTVALIIAAMLLASAPAFAAGGAIKFSYGPCGDVCSQIVVTPSENINQHQDSHPNGT
jgi:hypothetical protein